MVLPPEEMIEQEEEIYVEPEPVEEGNQQEEGESEPVEVLKGAQKNRSGVKGYDGIYFQNWECNFFHRLQQ